MSCYWSCRIGAARDDGDYYDVNKYLRSCADDFGRDGHDCAEICDEEYLENDDTCEFLSNQCWEACNDYYS